MKYVFQFTQTIDLHIPERDALPMNVALNLHHAGKIMLERDERPSPAHEEAAYASHRHYLVEVRVGVTDEGHLKLLGVVNSDEERLLREVVRETVRQHHDPLATVNDTSADITIRAARSALLRKGT